LLKALRLAVLVYFVTSCGLDVSGVEPAPPLEHACVFDGPTSFFDAPPCEFAP
jgi:hypothetical protein